MASWKKYNLLGFMHASTPRVMSDDAEVQGFFFFLFVRVVRLSLYSPWATL